MPLPANAQSLSPTEARQIAEDAYVYGYSLITTEVTRVQMSNVPTVDAYKAPMGQFINVPKYPAADVRVISAPNADTLYSMSWLDLAEPQVFSHPDMGNRFYLFEITDLWMTDSESSPSKRTAGGKAASYLFTPPGWKDEVPAGMKHIPMATRYMIILGRTYADGTGRRLQSGQCATGAVEGHAAIGLGQALYSRGTGGGPQSGFQHDRQTAARYHRDGH